MLLLPPACDRSKQALGVTGLLFGWTPMLQAKVQVKSQ
jgi:hypothetical protein